MKENRYRARAKSDTSKEKSLSVGCVIPSILTWRQAGLLVRGTGLTHREGETQVVVTAQL